MSALFNRAIRHEWLGKNPISFVRQGVKRERIPEVLEVSEIKALLTQLQHPYKAMVLVVAATGLRSNELLGLKWQDFDFDSLETNLCRGVVHEVVGELKTEPFTQPSSGAA